jgi:hypothetical protein
MINPETAASEYDAQQWEEHIIQHQEDMWHNEE